MRLIKLTAIVIVLSAGLVGALEFNGTFYGRFGSDFTRAEIGETTGDGDGDDIYFGELILRPGFQHDFGDWGGLAGTLSVDYDAAGELGVELREGYAEFAFAPVADLRVGLHDLRFGAGGHYNWELDGPDAVGRVYQSRPLGLRAVYDFGALDYDFFIGLGRTDLEQDALAAGFRVNYDTGALELAAYAVADATPHDVRELFFDQYVSRAPGMRDDNPPDAWTFRMDQFAGELETRHDPLQTLALGLELSNWSSEPGYRLLVAYHNYADLVENASSGLETGGMHLFVYPELTIRSGWFDGYVAAHFDYWGSNDADGLNVFTPYDSEDPIASTMAYEVYFEPGVLLGDGLRIALGGGYTEPSTAGENVEGTSSDESLDASFFGGPRVCWTPRLEEAWLNLVLGGDYRQWAVALYDVEGSEVDESREITAWVRAEVQF